MIGDVLEASGVLQVQSLIWLTGNKPGCSHVPKLLMSWQGRGRDSQPDNPVEGASPLSHSCTMFYHKFKIKLQAAKPVSFTFQVSPEFTLVICISTNLICALDDYDNLLQ